MFSFQGTIEILVILVHNASFNESAAALRAGIRRHNASHCRKLANNLLRKCLTGRLLGLYAVAILLCKIAGGDEENRTPDPLLARQVLSQLSYTPKFCIIWIMRPFGSVYFVTVLMHSRKLLTSCKQEVYAGVCLTRILLPQFCFAKLWWA